MAHMFVNTQYHFWDVPTFASKMHTRVPRKQYFFVTWVKNDKIIDLAEN